MKLNVLLRLTPHSSGCRESAADRGPRSAEFDTLGKLGIDRSTKGVAVAKGFYTQGVVVLLRDPVSIGDVSERLAGYGIEKVIESGSDWAFGGPTVVVPFRPESNGFVAVDTVDRVWPDDMGDPKDESMVFGAWSMGHFGPFAFPGSLERATQQAWHWEEGRSAPLTHRAFLRVRCSYVFGASDDCPVLPSHYEPLSELLFITTVGS